MRFLVYAIAWRKERKKLTNSRKLLGGKAAKCGEKTYFDEQLRKRK